MSIHLSRGQKVSLPRIGNGDSLVMLELYWYEGIVSTGMVLEFQDGTMYVINAQSQSFGSLDQEPYVQLGESGKADRLSLDMAHMESVRRAVVFVYAHDGHRYNGGPAMVLRYPGRDEYVAETDGVNFNTCVVAEFKPDKAGGLTMEFTGMTFWSLQHMGEHYGWSVQGL